MRIDRIIKASHHLGKKFPTTEGKDLAHIALDMPLEGLVIDLRGVSAALQVASFFNAFFQAIYDRAGDLALSQAKQITWVTDYGFQKEGADEFTALFTAYDPPEEVDDFDKALLDALKRYLHSVEAGLDSGAQSMSHITIELRIPLEVDDHGRMHSECPGACLSRKILATLLPHTPDA